MNATTENRVIVVGAGPVGLLCALELARRNVPVLVIEAEPGTTLDLRAGTFHPPTLEMLQESGVTDAMMAIGIRVPRWQTRDREYGLIVEWDLAALEKDTPFPFRLHLEQHRLTPILLDMLLTHPHAEVRFGHEFVSLVQDADGVTATAKTAQGEVEIRGSWLVGADGGRSAVRKSADIGFGGYTWPERYSVISTTFDLAPLGYADNAYISDPEQWIAFFRMPDNGPPGLWRMTVPVHQDISDEQVLDPAFAAAAINRVLHTPADTSYPIVHQSVYRVHQRVADQFRAGRVLLAGDSAHVNNPLGGFGLNSGIHDAMNLGDKLARVFKAEAQADLLDLYERQRRTVANEYVQTVSVKNKQNLEEKDLDTRLKRFSELRDIAADPQKTREYLLISSMINSIKRANAIQ
ncbi:MAG: FAD-dependent oxidoreductase [Pseudomonadota bacterium]